MLWLGKQNDAHLIRGPAIIGPTLDADLILCTLGQEQKCKINSIIAIIVDFVNTRHHDMFRLAPIAPAFDASGG